MASGIFEPFYAAQVLSELLSRQWGHEVKITLTPKEPHEADGTDSAGG